MRKELRLSGSGGQGVITAAIIFAEAALSVGKQVVQSQSYGPEARGGASKSEVILDDDQIFHPHVENPDVVLAMNQDAATKYYGDLTDKGILVLDEDLVPNPPDFKNTIKIPISKIAVDNLGKVLFANIVAVGVLTRVVDFIPLEDVKKAVANRVPKKFLDENMKAVQLGYDAAAKLLG